MIATSKGFKRSSICVTCREDLENQYDNILIAMEFKRISFDNLIDATGLSKSVLKKYLKYRQNYIPYEKYKLVLDYLELSKSYLLKKVDLKVINRGELFQNISTSNAGSSSLANQFGRGVRFLRTQEGKHISHIARAIGYSEHRIYSIENGLYKKGSDLCFKLVQYFNLPLGTIIEYGILEYNTAPDGHDKLSTKDQNILKTLKENNYDISKVAKQLNYTTQYVYAFMSSRGVDYKKLRAKLDDKQIYKTYLDNKRDPIKTCQKLRISRSYFDKAKGRHFPHEKNLRREPQSKIDLRNKTKTALENAKYDYDKAAKSLNIKVGTLRSRARRLLTKSERLSPEKITKSHKYSYQEAKDYLKELNFTSCKQFQLALKSKELSEKIPTSPAHYYKDSGWQSWNDFLDNDNTPVREEDKQRYFEFKAKSAMLN